MNPRKHPHLRWRPKSPHWGALILGERQNPRRHYRGGRRAGLHTQRAPLREGSPRPHSCRALVPPLAGLPCPPSHPQGPALSLGFYPSEGSSSAELVFSSWPRSPPHLQGRTEPLATSRVAPRGPGAVSRTLGVCSSPDSQPHAATVPQPTWPHTPACLGPLLRMSPRSSVPKKLASNLG